MVEYSSYRVVESTARPGVSYRLRRMSEGRRRELTEIQAAGQARIDAVRVEMEELRPAYRESVARAEAAVQPERDRLIAAGVEAEEARRQTPVGALDMPAAELQRMIDLSARVQAIHDAELRPAAVRYVLAGIDGLTIDGDAATLELVMERGPDTVYAEIAEAVEYEMGMSTAERENLPSPSTSPAAVEGSAESGSAERAGKLVAITSGAAPNTTGPVSASAPAIA